MTDVVMSGVNVVMALEDPTIAGRVVVSGAFLLSTYTGKTVVVLGLRF
jgi:hypothetical protein